MLRELKTLLFFGALCLLVPPKSIYAVELSITDNGSGSTSVVSETNTNQTTVSSNNDASVTNNVSSTANSGSNTVNGSSDAASVSTGNTESSAAVTNEVNTNIVEASPCPCDGQSNLVTVSGNGSGTTNTATSNTISINSVYSTQNAVITNNIVATSDSGNNRITNAQGAASITTGDAKVVVTIQNVSNNSYIKVNGNVVNQSSLVIKNNGAMSINSLLLSVNGGNTIYSSNNANIINSVNATANTGNNFISSSGLASIKTGNATTSVTVSNTVNSSKVVITGCCKNDDPSDPGDPGVPTTPGGTISSTPSGNSGGGSGSGGSGSGGGGDVLGASAILPVTGVNVSMWATIFNVLMLLIGLYLRMKSGRSPARN